MNLRDWRTWNWRTIIKTIVLVVLILLGVSLAWKMLTIKFADPVDLQTADIYSSFQYQAAILSIAITAWLGLNIYNVIERSELQEVHRKLEISVEDYEQKIQKLEIQSKQLKQDYDDLQKQVLSEKISIFKSRVKFKNTWFYVISKMCENNTVNSPEFFDYLIQIEQLYNDSYDYYVNNNFRYIERMCDEGLHLCEEADGILNGLGCEAKDTQWKSIYLPVRKSDFYYFKSRCFQSQLKRDADKNKEAIKLTAQIWDSLNHETTILTKVETEVRKGVFKGIKPDGSDDVEGWTEYLNTLALGFLLLNTSCGENSLSKAQRYLEECIATGYPLAKAHRNLGVALYREEKINEAIEQYKMAVDIDLREYKAYLNLASLYLKTVSDILFKMVNGELRVVDPDCIEDKDLIQPYIEEAIDYLNSGIHYSQEPREFHNRLGWAYTCLALVDSDEVEQKKHLEAAERELKIAEISDSPWYELNLKRLKAVKGYYDRSIAPVQRKY